MIGAAKVWIRTNPSPARRRSPHHVISMRRRVYWQAPHESGRALEPANKNVLAASPAEIRRSLSIACLMNHVGASLKLAPTMANNPA